MRIGTIVTFLACSGAAEEHALLGKVVDARTGRPVSSVQVFANDRFHLTGDDGDFRVALEDSGTVRLRLQHHWFESDSLVLDPDTLGTRALNLRLNPLEEPCCTLQGQWHIEVHADTAGWSGRVLEGPAAGVITFAQRHRRVLRGMRSRYDDPQSPYEPGWYDIDWSVIFPRRVSLTQHERDSLWVAWGEVRFLERLWSRYETVGWVHHGDSVTVFLGPLGSHSGYGLSGRMFGGTASGRWVEGSQGKGAHGVFTMQRVQ